MSCLILMIITLITAKTVVVCNNDLTETSRVFSVTSYGRLPGELLLAVSKNVVGDCLYACMQHFACLTINYHKPSGECQLLADILYKEKIIPDVKWESYGHFESEIVRYVYCYILSADEYSLAKLMNNKSFTVFFSLILPSFMQLSLILQTNILFIFYRQ